jgi:hypothetical protein
MASAKFIGRDPWERSAEVPDNLIALQYPLVQRFSGSPLTPYPQMSGGVARRTEEG